VAPKLGHTETRVQKPATDTGSEFGGSDNDRQPHEQEIEETFVTYTIAEPCVDLKDKACIEECPVDCIYEGTRMLYIHPDECVDCGACEPVCPVEAIYYEDDVPEQWTGYTQINADFFAELGSPGGASKVGMTENDPQSVKDLPPQAHD
jgi:NAD-dependent dihydropyrimidine dehydrogenase PreA subunit